MDSSGDLKCDQDMDLCHDSICTFDLKDCEECIYIYDMWAKGFIYCLQTKNVQCKYEIFIILSYFWGIIIKYKEEF